VKIELDVKDFDESQFMQMLVERALQRADTLLYDENAEANTKWSQRIVDHVRTLVDAKAHALIDARLEATIEKVIAEGISMSANEYVKSPAVPLETIIRAQLEKRGGGGYNDRDKGTLVEQVAAKVIADALHTELRKDLEKIRADFKKQVDDVLASKLLEIVRGVDKR
jgi:hypothetical protein